MAQAVTFRFHYGYVTLHCGKNTRGHTAVALRLPCCYTHSHDRFTGHLSLKEFVALCFPDMADDLPDLDDKDNANAAAEREKAAALEAQQAIARLSERQAGIVSEQMQQAARVCAHATHRTSELPRSVTVRCKRSATAV